MKATKTLLVAALAAAGMAMAADAQAGFSRPGFSGGHNFSGGRHFSGFHRGFSPRFGVFIGAPILWSSWYWGYPYYYDYYGPRVIYRDVEPYPASYPEGYIEPAPTTDIGPRTQGAPAQAPAYLNYCDSAKAYFPKVTSCPEGWRFEPTR
jgi:opacity protein-like surface antigen